MRRFLKSAAFALTILFASPALADKVAVLPFSSPNNTSRPELEEARKWTREAVAKRGNTYATNDEMVSAEAAVKDGVPDTTQEYVAAGKAAAAQWTLVAHVERVDHASSKMPDGTEEDGYTTYKMEIEACLVDTGRVESLSREVFPDEASDDIAEMLGILVRPEGIANAYIPWEDATRKPKRKPKPKPPEPPPPPPAPVQPAPPPAPKLVYGQGHPFLLGAVAGVNAALVRPDQARGTTLAMPIGGAFGYALPDDVPGLELRAQVTGQAIGPSALALGAGARYAFSPVSRFYVGPEVLLGAHVALGADKTTRFLAQGSLFFAFAVTDFLQLELAGDIGAAVGASTLVLGGGTGRIAVRF